MNPASTSVDGYAIADQKYPKPEVGSTEFTPADPSLDSRTAGQWALMTVRSNPNPNVKNVAPEDACWSHVWSYENPNKDEGNNARMAYRVYVGPLKHRYVSHTCATVLSDTCCNPDHIVNVKSPLKLPTELKSWEMDGSESVVDNRPYIKHRAEMQRKKPSRASGKTKSSLARGKKSDDAVRDIRHRYINGDPVEDIAEAHSISGSTVRDIAYGRYYRHVPGPVAKSYARQRTPVHKSGLTNEQVRDIRVRYHEQHETFARLLNEVGVSDVTLVKLLSGQTYRKAGGPTTGHIRRYPTRTGLTEAQALQLKFDIDNGLSKPAAAAKYKVSVNTVYNVLNNRFHYGSMEPAM